MLIHNAHPGRGAAISAGDAMGTQNASVPLP